MSSCLDWFDGTKNAEGLQTEVFEMKKESRVVGLSEGKPHITTSDHATDYCLRVIQDGRQGVFTTTHLGSDNFVPALEKTIMMARASSQDDNRSFFRGPVHASAAPEIDQQIFSEPTSGIIDMLKDLESRILKTDARIKKVLRLQFQEVRQRKSIANSWNVKASSTSTVTSVMGELLAEEGAMVEAGWDTYESRFGRDLDLPVWSQKLADDTIQLLGAKTLASGSKGVVFHPRVGTSLLSLLSQALSAEAVQLGRSFLKGHMEQLVFNPTVTLIDDPLLPNGVATDICDDEGVSHRRMVMAESGVLKAFFYDVRSARRDQVESNGHGLKSGVSAPPSPQPTNLYLQPGSGTFDDLLKKESEIFLLKDVMGLHMADPITGEFSLGASGAWYKNGQFQHAVRGVTIAGNVLSVFKNIASLGNELHWRGSYGAPYFYVPSMTIAGT